MVVRALREQLVLDVNAGNAGADEFSNGAHGVQRLAEARPGVGHDRNPDTGRHRLGDIDLFGHGHQRFGRGPRSAGDISAT